MMGRILFLDIDGVVLSGEELWRTGDHRYLPPEKIALVNEVCARTGAEVVVSSTWRSFDYCQDMLLRAGICLHRDWRTELESKTGSIIIGCRRGEQIKRWLHWHPEISSYAIVDDDSDMLPEQMERFVKTPFTTGIDREHVEGLVEILSTVAALESKGGGR